MDIIEMVVTLLIIVSLIELVKNIKNNRPTSSKCRRLFKLIHTDKPPLKRIPSLYFHYNE